MISCIRLVGVHQMSSRSVTVLVGTTKGAFLVAGSNGDGWSVRGPFCDGWPINHIIGDPATGTLWAAGGGDWHGAGVWRSPDGGENWDLAPADPGLHGRLGRERSGLRGHDQLGRRGAAFRRHVLADMVAGLCPWHAVCRYQAREPARQHRWRDNLGKRRGPEQPSLRRQLEPRRRRPGAAHHRRRSVGP